MLNPDKTLNEEYFKAPRNLWWLEEDEAKLIQGVEKHGIGAWTVIKQEFLPLRQENEIRIKCMGLLGKQDLTNYYGWKGNKEAM